MSRLPTVGSDDGNWGTVLNDFLAVSHNGDGTHRYQTNVKDYGAIGDGVTDDSTAFQTAINAVTALGGGTVYFPPTSAGYKFTTGMEITPMNLTGKLVLSAYGAKLVYTGNGDALKVNSNIASDAQNGERTVHVFGLHIIGSGSAVCGIRNYGCSRASFTDTLLDGFTSTTVGQAALILDARFHYWIEENHFDGLEITNSGNGICFISEDDFGGVSASCMNNVFTAVSIWITQANGKGIYGVGNGGTSLVQLARCVFDSIVVHAYSALNITGFDLTACYSAGVVFNGASVDAYGVVTGLIAVKYELPEPVCFFGFTAFPTASVTTWFTGAGKYVILGGNSASGSANGFLVDSTGNLVSNTLTLLYDIYDSNGKTLIHQLPGGSSVVNRIAIGNATTNNPPYITPDGSDSNIGLSLYGKGTGKVLIDGYRVDSLTQQLVIPRYTTGNFSNFGNHAVIALGNGGICYFDFLIPVGFSTLVAADILGIADATETIQFDIDVDSATDNEVFNTNVDTIVNQTKSTTVNRMWFQSILTGFDGVSLSAEDVVGVKFTSNTDFLYIIGLRLRFA